MVDDYAISTYNFKYYFYDDYYTYTADQMYQIDSYSNDYQEGASCYSYQHTKTSVVQKDLKCTQYNLPYNKKPGDLLGMLVGLSIGAIGVGIFVFAGCEIRRLHKRNRYQDYKVNLHKKKATKRFVKQSAHDFLFSALGVGGGGTQRTNDAYGSTFPMGLLGGNRKVDDSLRHNPNA